MRLCEAAQLQAHALHQPEPVRLQELLVENGDEKWEMKEIGIQLNSNYDIAIAVRHDNNGLITSGVVIEHTNYQRVRLIVQAQKGEFKEYTTLGFGVDNWLKKANPNRQQFINELQKELRSDGIEEEVVVSEDLQKFSIEL